MHKWIVGLALVAGVTFTIPAQAEDSGVAGMKDQKASMQKGKTPKENGDKPSTTGAAQDAKDATKKSQDDPKSYGKPDKH